MTGEDLRRTVEGDIAAVLERADTQRRGHGRVADDDRGMRRGGIEVGHGQQGVGRRLEEDEVCGCRRRPGLVELDHDDAPSRRGGRTAADARSTHPRRARSSLRGAAASAPPSSPPPCRTDRGVRARRRARRAPPHRRRRSDGQRGRTRSDPAPRPDTARWRSGRAARSSADATTPSTETAPARSGLRRNGARRLMRHDLPLHPLQRVVDRLAVALELLGHPLVRAAVEVQPERL